MKDSTPPQAEKITTKRQLEPETVQKIKEEISKESPPSDASIVEEYSNKGYEISQEKL